MLPLSWMSVFILAAITPAAIKCDESQSLKEVANGSNEFASDLYQVLKNESGNIICSPISADIVLALAQHGARGATADEMAKVLHLPANQKTVLEGHKALITDLQDAVLKLATRLFIEKDFEIKPNYKSDANEYFLSDAELKDFLENPESARKEINKWVEDKTNNKITNLLPEGSVTRSTALVLVNAIHFKANWVKRFDKNNTKMEPFFVTPTKPVDVPMMNLRNVKFNYKFTNKLNAKICELPYEGNKFSMVLVVPERLDGLPYVESQLAHVNIMEEISGGYETTLNLKLPKSKIEKNIDMTEILPKMGMKLAFTRAANFSGISEVALAISKVVQKAFVEVNEEGTEAAAATAVSMIQLTSANSPPPIPINVVCNRPFLFFIVKRPSILFISRVSKF